MVEVGWGQLGPWGLVSVFVLMVATGLLIPRWTHNQRISDRDKTIELLQKALDKRDAQVDRMVEQQNITIKLLEDIKKQSLSVVGRHRDVALAEVAVAPDAET